MVTVALSPNRKNWPLGGEDFFLEIQGPAYSWYTEYRGRYTAPYV
jgi:hypothetical protein